MFQRIVSAVLLLASVFLTGCAGQNFYLAARDPQNPASHVFISGRVPGGQQQNFPVLCFKEDEGVYRMWCGEGTQLNRRNAFKDYICLDADRQEVPLESELLLGRIHQGACPAGVINKTSASQAAADDDGRRKEVPITDAGCPPGYVLAPTVYGSLGPKMCW